MIGQKLLHYEITALLGVGGMGEVYRARDTKLEREVALKLLPAEVAEDPERLARFHREARTLASLHHMRIASLFGIESSEDRTFLVMELVEGQDLAQRLDQSGALPLDEVQSVALQMAEGLEFAHENGIMHRDLKPANIKLTPQGEVKILDFGLARAFTGDSIEESQPNNSPTITAALTQAGVILGTAAYMSPEQAKGKSVDRRADIWSFGVVLFELLTGERLFRAETASETMASVMMGEIAWDRLPSDTPPGLRRLLHRCLDREPSTRLRDIGEARIMLSQSGTDELTASAAAASSRLSRLPWLLAAVATAVSAVAIFWVLGQDSAPAHHGLRTQADLLAGPGLGYEVSDIHFQLSPDGRRFAYTGIDDNGERWIYLRDLSTGELRRLEDTRDGESPFWSADSRRLGYFVGGALSIIGVEDGIVERSVVSLNSWAMDAGWHPDGWVILMANDTQGSIYRSDLTGGDPELLYSSGGTECAFSDPQVLPGGGIMYSEDYFDGSARSGTYVLRDGERRQILERAFDAHWVPQYDPRYGVIVFRRQQRIFAQRFDPQSLSLKGDPVRIGGPVRTKTFPNQGFMTVAGDGTIIYLEGSAGASDTELVWVDRQGQLVEELGVVGDLYSLDISHDGRRVAFDNSTAETAGDIWVYDLARRSSIRLTDHKMDESSPRWSNNDEAIFFFRGPDFMRVDLSNPPSVVELIADGTPRRPEDMHPVTGQFLFSDLKNVERSLRIFDPETGQEEVWLDRDGRQYRARFSPQGDWIAYTADEGERSQVWVESFPDRTERFRVSREDGGRYPEWRSDGREIFYLSPSRKLMAVPVDMAATDRRPVGEPQELFSVHLRQNAHYDVNAAGDRFLLNRFVGKSAEKSAVLVRGWRLDAADGTDSQ